MDILTIAFIIWVLLFLLVAHPIMIKHSLRNNEKYNLVSYIGLLLPNIIIFFGLTMLSTLLIFYPFYKLSKYIKKLNK